MKPDQIVLWHDKDIVLTIDNCDATLVVDETNPSLPYRWIELETGQRFAELDGWHYRLKYKDKWVQGWENFYED